MQVDVDAVGGMLVVRYAFFRLESAKKLAAGVEQRVK